MKTKAIEPTITFIVIFILALIIYLMLLPVFNSIWVLVISFYSLLCIYYQALSLVDTSSPSWKAIKFCSHWYIKNMGKTFGYFVIFFFYVTYIAAICFIVSFVLTMIVSPITYLVDYHKNK